ncbi:MAG: CBS domain-containing protein [Planctomycetota bacterium]
MLVRDFMTADVATIHVDKKLIAAHEIMESKNVRHVPVLDDHGALVGLISQRDLLRASLSSAKDQITNMDRLQHLGTIEVRGVMRTDIQGVDPEATVQAAARLMLSRKIGSLPVISGRKFVGIITDYDLLRVIAKLENSEPLRER